MSSHSPSSPSSLQDFVSASLSGVNLVAPAAPGVDVAMGQDAFCENTPWTLPQGRALTLKPRTAGVLRVLSGRAWATFDVSRHTPLTETGDHVVARGHDLQLRAGQRVVVEAWAYQGQDGIALQWVPAPESCAASRWQAAVADPLRDIGHGLGMVARATWRLLAGLAGYAGYLTAGRGRVLRGLDSNAP
nr:DUF2917 domain-containing protein [uncultured Rhodoferax sp.]